MPDQTPKRKVLAHLEWTNTTAHEAMAIRCRTPLDEKCDSNHRWATDNEEGKKGEYIPHGLIDEEDVWENLEP